MSAISLEKQISCVEREIKLRANVYAKRIESGAMTRGEATHEYRAMQAVLQTLQLVIGRKIELFPSDADERLRRENAELKSENERLRDEIRANADAHNELFNYLQEQITELKGGDYATA